MKKRVHLLAAVPFLSLLFITVFAFAGGSVENGGAGVVQGNNIYLLDLAEQGIEKAPFINDQVAVLPEVTGKVASFSQGQLSPDVELILARKISRMAISWEHSLYRPVMNRLEKYQLVFLKVPLKPIKGTDTAIAAPLVQLAINSGDSQLVQVVRSGYDQLDVANQAALILHEIVFASARSLSSRLTRSVTAQLFNPNLAVDTYENRWNLACNRREDPSYKCDDRRVLTIAPELIAEFVARHQIPFSAGDKWIDDSGNNGRFQLFMTDVHSGAVPEWFDKPGCYSNDNFWVLNTIKCVDTPVELGGALRCKDASGGTLHLYHTDSQLKYIVRYDHANYGLSGEALFSGYAFVGTLDYFQNNCR